jgi:phosphate starvation-inducible PhoH-like protein
LIEKEIILPEIDELEFFGPTNSKLKFIQSRFPKLKIVARGNKIKVNGDEEEIDRFELVLEQLFAHQGKYNALPLNMIENILDGHAEERSGHFTSGDGVLVFGPGGNKVVARTAIKNEWLKPVTKTI